MILFILLLHSADVFYDIPHSAEIFYDASHSADLIDLTTFVVKIHCAYTGEELMKKEVPRGTPWADVEIDFMEKYKNKAFRLVDEFNEIMDHEVIERDFVVQAIFLPLLFFVEISQFGVYERISGYFYANTLVDDFVRTIWPNEYENGSIKTFFGPFSEKRYKTLGEIFWEEICIRYFGISVRKGQLETYNYLRWDVRIEKISFGVHFFDGYHYKTYPPTKTLKHLLETSTLSCNFENLLERIEQRDNLWIEDEDGNILVSLYDILNRSLQEIIDEYNFRFHLEKSIIGEDFRFLLQITDSEVYRQRVLEGAELSKERIHDAVH